jgi:hypothetical protein
MTKFPDIDGKHEFSNWKSQLNVMQNFFSKPHSQPCAGFICWIVKNIEERNQINQNKGRNVTCPCTGRLNMVKMSILSNRSIDAMQCLTKSQEVFL